jgi:lambda family phage portal protein
MGILDTLRGLFHGKRAAPAKRATDYSSTYGNGSVGGFAGGAVGRLTASLASWSGAVNMDLDGTLEILRARGRQIGQNNEHGRRFLSMVATNIVGPHGPQLQVRAIMATAQGGKPALDKAANDAVEIHWARWCCEADIAGRMDFAHLCRTAVKSVARDGEVLVRIVRQPSLRYGMALQLLEVDRLDHSLNTALPGGAVIRQGVELDTTGRALAYYIKTAHPGDRYMTDRSNVERVPAGQMIHVFLQERPEQVRGYTWFHAVILRAMQLHGFNDAAVVAAKIGASKIAAIERPADQEDLMPSLADGQVNTGAGAGQSSPVLQMNVEAGEMFELPPGYKLNSWNPEYPHANFQSFVDTAMQGIATGLDVATHNLSGNMSGVNYSSARIAELSEREIWMVLQAWFCRVMVKRVYEEWLAIALLRGEITFPESGKSLPADKLPKFRDAAKFRGRRWSWVDPSKEIDAAAKAVELGVTSRTRIAAERGEDFEDVLDELRQERAMMKDAGLLQDPAPVRPSAPPAPAADE